MVMVLISTKDTPELSIVGGDWNKVNQVRSTLDSQVFYGALGQRKILHKLNIS